MKYEQGLTLSHAIDRAVAADPSGDPAFIAEGIVSSDFLALLTEEIKLRQKARRHYAAVSTLPRP